MLGANLAFGEPDALRQLVEHVLRRVASHDSAIDFLDAELGVRQTIGQLAVIGQEHQPNAHLVEPADRIHALGDLRQQVDDARLSGRVVVGRDVTLRLVDRDVDRFLAMDHLPVEGNLRLARINLGPQLSNDRSVDGNAALENQFLTSPARADACVREDLLKALQTPWRRSRKRTIFALSRCTVRSGRSRALRTR
jgi:hypothetical protein